MSEIEVKEWLEKLYSMQPGGSKLEKLIFLDILLCKVMQNKIRRGELITEDMMVAFYKAMYFILSEYVIFSPTLYDDMKRHEFSFNHLEIDLVTGLAICHLTPWLFHSELPKQLSLLKTYVDRVRVIIHKTMKEVLQNVELGDSEPYGIKDKHLSIVPLPTTMINTLNTK